MGRRKGGLGRHADLRAGCAFSSGGLAFPEQQRQSTAYFQVCGGNLPPDTNGAEILNRLNFADRQAEFAADAAAQKG